MQYSFIVLLLLFLQNLTHPHLTNNSRSTAKPYFERPSGLVVKASTLGARV